MGSATQVAAAMPAEVPDSRPAAGGREGGEAPGQTRENGDVDGGRSAEPSDDRTAERSERHRWVELQSIQVCEILTLVRVIESDSL